MSDYAFLNLLLIFCLSVALVLHIIATRDEPLAPTLVVYCTTDWDCEEKNPLLEQQGELP
jgi:hypothetical protein